jgi:tRNA pseudouridine13 synthase
MILRRTPDDFRVVEVLTTARTSAIAPTRAREHTHAIYQLEKVSLTTPEAAARLARALGVKPGAVAHAGLKDKHARTTQHVSVASPPSATLAHTVEQPATHARLLGWSTSPLSARDIAHNEFTIVARDLTRDHARALRIRAALLAPPATTPPHAPALRFANAFGEQRFGSARHAQGFAAPLLIQGDFEPALRLLIATPARKDTGAKRAFTRLCATHWGQWPRLAAECPACPERRAIEHLARIPAPAPSNFRDAFAALPMSLQDLCVDAYQSMLWNDAVARFFRAIRPEHALVTSTTDWGALVSPASNSPAPPDPSDPSAPLDTLRLPLPGPHMDLADCPAELRAAMAATLAAHNHSPLDLTIPGLRRPQFGSPQRAVIAHATAFQMHDPAPDDLGRAGRCKLTLRFALPPGAYATVLLRLLEG